MNEREAAMVRAKGQRLWLDLRNKTDPMWKMLDRVEANGWRWPEFQWFRRRPYDWAFDGL